MHRYLGRDFDNEESTGETEDERRWDVVLAQYGWGTADGLDGALIKFIDISVFNCRGRGGDGRHKLHTRVVGSARNCSLPAPTEALYFSVFEQN
jgi:hypothetical protein